MSNVDYKVSSFHEAQKESAHKKPSIIFHCASESRDESPYHHTAWKIDCRLSEFVEENVRWNCRV